MADAIVTGGAGFIGSHIVDLLVEGGFKVHVVDDLSTGSRENLSQSPDISFYEMDIRSQEMRDLIVRIKPEVFVHAAAQISVRVSMEDPPFDASVNVVGLLNILSSFDKGSMPFFVFLSTGGAMYGEQRVFPADETHPAVPDSVYGMSKRAGELYLDLWRRSWGLQYVSLRLANVYGPRQNPHGEAGVVAIFTERLLRGEPHVINGSGEQTRDFVFVSDVARAVGLVVEKKVSGIYNIGTGKETSVNRLYEIICTALGKEQRATHGPPKEGEQLRSSIDPQKALQTFGWRPAFSLQSGIKETARWFSARVENQHPRSKP